MDGSLFQVRADDRNALYLKYAFDKDFVRVDLVRCNRRSTPNPHLVLLYTGPLNNSAAKYRDLQILCTSGLIPGTYHPFYNLLKYVKTEENKCNTVMVVGLLL